jgi:ketosteroid isomerase-like protein
VTDAERFQIEWACARLINLYATLNDEARWEAVVDLYAPDGLMTRPTAPDQPIVGREALLAAFKARPPRTTQHVCTNIVVTVEGPDTASATSAMLLFTGPDAPPLVGAYRDRFVRLNGRWVFSERRGALSFPPST